MKTTITTLIVLSTIMLAQAQMPVWIQITGQPESKMVLGEEYTKEEIIKKYGNIVNFSSFYDDEIYFTTICLFEMKNHLMLETRDNKLGTFSFSDPNMELRMEEWGISIKPGDNVDDYLKLPKDKAFRIETYSDHITLYPVINGAPYDISIFLRFDEKDRKITTIEWFEPV